MEAAVKKAEYLGWTLFASRSFDGRWWGWILNEARGYVYCDHIPCPATAPPQEAQRFVWRVASERKGVEQKSEPDWIEVSAV
jgi:hypothetical protein